MSNDRDEWEVIGVSGRMLFSGTKTECEKWVADGNVGGGYSIERKAACIGKERNGQTLQ